jgi:hypothetical protein
MDTADTHAATYFVLGTFFGSALPCPAILSHLESTNTIIFSTKVVSIKQSTCTHPMTCYPRSSLLLLSEINLVVVVVVLVVVVTDDTRAQFL